MSNTSKPIEINQISAHAFQYLLDHNIKPTPDHYKIMFCAFEKKDSPILAELNNLFQTKGKITEHDLKRFYYEYAEDDESAQKMNNINLEMSSQISNILGSIKLLDQGNAAYTESLQSASAKMENMVDPESISILIADLVKTTKEAEARNKSLEAELHETKTNIEYLNKDLETIKVENFKDSLTSLANRKHFDQFVSTMVSEFNAGEVNDFSLLLLDIDHFKKFNDTYGHQVGDQVLRLVSACLRNNVKGQDLAARYGGEEFAVVLPNTSLENAKIVGENIRKAIMIKEMHKKSTGERLGRVTVSVGVSMWKAGDTAHALIERADSCLYMAKGLGRNNVVSEDKLKLHQQNVA